MRNEGKRINRDWAINNWPLPALMPQDESLASVEPENVSPLKIPSVRVVNGLYVIKDFEIPGNEYFSGKVPTPEKLERRRLMASKICEQRFLLEPYVEVSEESGIFTRIVIPEKGSIALVKDPGTGRLSYQSSDVSDINVALALQLMAGGSLVGAVEPDVLRPYVDYYGDNKGFLIRNLSVPLENLDLSKENEEFTKNRSNEFPFFNKASEIAQEFSQTLSIIRLSQGTLRYVSIERTGCTTSLYLRPSALDYSTDKNVEYWSHNIDTIQQAFALQGIVAEFINNSRGN